MSEKRTQPAKQPLIVVKSSPFNAEAPLGAFQTAITPVAQFYVRSNFAVPNIKPDQWSLSVSGSVHEPVVLTYGQLQEFPARTVTSTMECAGNSRTGMSPLPVGEPWGQGAVSTGIWRGVSLRDVLQAVQPLDSTLEIVFTGADGGPREGQTGRVPFARSLPIEKALDPDVLLAYELNKEPLPAEHGGPVRLLVPGWYGMASVKWVTQITAVERPFTGHFQTERYVLEVPGVESKEPVGEMRVKSLITYPAPGDVLTSGRHTIRGVAWSGAGAISRVEVSLDGDSAWQTARLGEAQPYTWQAWELECELSKQGRYVARARATDEKGNSQPDIAPWNRLGYANNAVQYTIFAVRSD